MHQTACDGLPVSYSTYTSTPELGEYCTTQSTGHSIDFTAGEGSPFTPSPASQGTETSEPILTPASDLPPLPLRTEISPYPYQDSHPVTPSSTSKRMLLTPPPSTSYEVDEIDTNSPIISAPGFQSGIYCPASSAVPSPRSWPSSEPQELKLPQFSWGPENLPSQNMGMFSSSFDDQFPRQATTSTYGDSSFNLQSQMESQSSGHHSDTGMVPNPTGQSPVLSMHEESPQQKIEMPDAYNFDDDEEMHDLAAPADASEGDEGAKSDEPYARLIYRAFMSRERHAMTLQEIYQWFRDNTEKAKSESKGWQNSIRHNLSMNAAFVKRERKASSGDVLSEPQEPKKSTEWVLEDWAVRDGVQSTTRYRKGNPSRRAGSAAHHRTHGSISSRATSGRRGGISTSKNKAVSTKRSIMSRTTNPEMFSGHADPFPNPMYSRPMSYPYDPNHLNAPIATTDMDHADLIFRAPLPTLPTPGSGIAYSYRGHHNQAIPSFPQQGHPHTLYSMGNVTGVYPGPQLPAHTSSGYNNIFANPEELAEERTNYLGWNGSTPGGGAYHP
ncbi:hypothetical protein HD806DRAFT_543366 [Xylariaceae sp. AK1471]|nr:hypothetical protein HD806DRAFT_543366 [Xylariaceae sp. AK1471]